MLTPVKVKNIRKIAKPDKVYDITVKNNHNLFVCNEINEKPILAHNCGYDVAVLHGIMEQQLLRAEHAGHKKYYNVVKYLIGDTIQVFSTMNVNGVLVDNRYLWWLASKQSPINGAVQSMEDEILKSPEVTKAEAALRVKNKTPSAGLFGAVTSKLFNLRKKEHLQTLFFNIMKLEPINMGAAGPALDKTFQDEYQDVPLVAAYTGLVKAKKIRDAFVKSLIKIMSKNEDAKVDGRIRPSFNYLRVVTGRTSANNPNLQQVPSRGKLSKYIKRVFVARPGTIFIKVDYSAHEVRGWSLISGDKNVAAAFQKGIDLYKNYIWNPTKENWAKFKAEGDIHIINSAYFFGLKVSEVTDDIRQGVKGVTFGLIYGRSANSLAAQLGKSIEEVNAIIDKFFTRFKVASNWLLEIEKFARKNYYVEAPTGLRRHLWPYLLPNTKERSKNYNGIAAACDRRARNSPIQGMGSGIGYSAARFLEKWIFERFREESLAANQLPIRNQNMVHDAIEHEVDLDYIVYATEMIREALTTGVQGKCEEKFGMSFPVDLSIDMEIGATMDTVQKWDGTISELHRILKETFEYQKNELKHDIDVDAALEQVFTGYMSKVLLHQAQTGHFDLAKKYGLLKRKYKEKVKRAA
jgi:DNA polymerase I-like protein with 3'-5' exonuclease and polymerase domains